MDDNIFRTERVEIFIPTNWMDGWMDVCALTLILSLLSSRTPDRRRRRAHSSGAQVEGIRGPHGEAK
jgi:hypothetical protein